MHAHKYGWLQAEMDRSAFEMLIPSGFNFKTLWGFVSPKAVKTANL